MGLAFCRESGGNKEEINESHGKDEAIEKKKLSKKTESGRQANDAPLNGVIVVEGTKHCKCCGNPLED